jgi:hypothetical protein
LENARGNVPCYLALDVFWELLNAVWVVCVLKVEDVLEFQFGVTTQATVQGVVGHTVLQELCLDHVDVEVWCLPEHRFFGLHVMCQGV